MGTRLGDILLVVFSFVSGKEYILYINNGLNRNIYLHILSIPVFNESTINASLPELGTFFRVAILQVGKIFRKAVFRCLKVEQVILHITYCLVRLVS